MKRTTVSSSPFVFCFRLILAAVFFGVSYYLLIAVFAPVYRVDVKLSSDHKDSIQIVEWNGLSKNRFQEQHSHKSKLFMPNKIQVVSIHHAPYSLKAVRIDPGEKPGVVKIYSVTLYNSLLGGSIYTAKDLHEYFSPNTDIGQYELKDDYLIVQATGTDPRLISERNLPPFYRVIVVMLAFIFSCVVFLLSNNIIENAREFIASSPAVTDIKGRRSTEGTNIQALNGLRGLGALFVLAEHTTKCFDGLGGLGGVLVFFIEWFFSYKTLYKGLQSNSLPGVYGWIYYSQDNAYRANVW